jgi:hypothetical protein
MEGKMAKHFTGKIPAGDRLAQQKHSDKQNRWFEVYDKHEDEKTGFWKWFMQTKGYMDENGLLNPNRLRMDCSGKSHTGKLALIGGGIAAVASLIAYLALKGFLVPQHDALPPPPQSHAPTVEAYVHAFMTDVAKTVIAEGNITIDKNNSLSALEISLQEPPGASAFSYIKEMISGTSYHFSKTFNVTGKEPGPGKAIFKATNNDGKSTEISKDFTLGNLAPVITYLNVSKPGSDYNVKVNYNDDNNVASLLLYILDPKTNAAIRATTIHPNNKTGNLTLNLSDLFNITGLANGKYVLVAQPTDVSGKDGLEKRVNFDFVGPVQNQAPVISSYNIESGLKQPHLWINATDDVSVNIITFELYNKDTGVLAFTKSYNPNKQVANVTDKLDFSSVPKGNYTAKFKATDNQGKDSIVREMSIEVPNTAPKIVGIPQLTYDPSNGHWSFKVNATDIDCNGDYINIKAIHNSSGSVEIDTSYKNINNLQSWTADSWFTLVVPGEYIFQTFVIDKEGVKSEVFSERFIQN